MERSMRTGRARRSGREDQATVPLPGRTRAAHRGQAVPLRADSGADRRRSGEAADRGERDGEPDSPTNRTDASIVPHTGGGATRLCGRRLARRGRQGTPRRQQHRPAEADTKAEAPTRRDTDCADTNARHSRHGGGAGRDARTDTRFTKQRARPGRFLRDARAGGVPSTPRAHRDGHLLEQGAMVPGAPHSPHVHE